MSNNKNEPKFNQENDRSLLIELFGSYPVKKSLRQAAAAARKLVQKNKVTPSISWWLNYEKQAKSMPFEIDPGH